jgi:hypothetical protein
MFGVVALMADHSNLVPFFPKMVPTGFLALEMCRKTEYVHHYYFTLIEA